jgi:hypothetical protein
VIAAQGLRRGSEMDYPVDMAVHALKTLGLASSRSVHGNL